MDITRTDEYAEMEAGAGIGATIFPGSEFGSNLYEITKPQEGRS
jgi:hypothetical protein